MNQSYYDQVSRSFDQAARNYDELYQHNRIMAWMRAESLALLSSVFPSGSRLLEIGCGTGDEAIALSRSGYQVVATDISPAMIETAMGKAQALGVEGVSWYAWPAGRVDEDNRFFADSSFDGIYSSFGALNCEPHLDSVASTCARLLRAGGKLVCSVMSRWCIWEIGWALIHLHFRQAFRRSQIGRGWIPAGLASPDERLSVPVRYYNPGSFARFFAPQFRVCQVRGLPVIVPPPDLSPLIERYPSLLNGLQKMDYRLRDRFPFHSMGDHFAIVLQRSGSDGDS